MGDPGPIGGGGGGLMRHGGKKNLKIISASLLITFLYPEIATSIDMNVAFPLSRIVMSGVLLDTVLSVCTVCSIMRLAGTHSLFLFISLLYVIEIIFILITLRSLSKKTKALTRCYPSRFQRPFLHRLLKSTSDEYIISPKKKIYSS